jgi:cystathionine beta-lyase/cystathionine gamma-synthase
VTTAGGGEHEQLGFATRAVHAAKPPDVIQTPSSVPIYQASTWGFDSTEEYASVINLERQGHVYGRGYGNPTVEAFEAVMASLEGTEAAFGFSSGMSAIHCVVTALADSGARVVSSREIYGGTYGLFEHILPRHGVAVDYVDPHDEDAVRAALPGAALFYCETIANPLCTVADLAALGTLCSGLGVPSVVDSTFASPYLCTPAALGFDYVIHSATKYIGGHSDLIGGAVCCTAVARKRLREVSIDVGGAMQPLEAWLCIRGLQTLGLRMERHCESALALAGALEGNSRISAVHYPGLPGHPQHLVAARELRQGCYGGVLSFEVDGGVENVAAVCDRLEIAWLGASLGGGHTLVTHPASTTHRQLDAEARRASGLGDGLVRVSVGLEDVADLIDDFEQALLKS